MKASKTELDNFTKLLVGLIAQADNIEAICYALNRLTLTELEKVKTYFSGSGTRVAFIRQSEIIIGTFVSGMMIFIYNMYQTNFFMSTFSEFLFVYCLLSFIRLFFARKPIRQHVKLAYNRAKFDRIVSLADIILNSRYEKELQNTVDKFASTDNSERKSQEAHFLENI
ncbi:hypothetical protein BMT55_05580 [Listeria newyorkensis]|uniref:Uncharacterized protein n=1 Tax=Listeria newyorkensis TaxID=1497681 RepID=A0ABX4XQI9_9LIST|nr:hypothetical protein [Listeria newyorkensis]KGL40186.1 hypothetical protein EP58_13615 [Listeria newyorkensis]KMT63434.1 hypothetical protein X559_0202 [Listeria newyorkensis]PNP93464.1 hypothetical protein BMT55_05580 [Listeria newyorkensis]WAO21086.1 hypothetical protein OTR81_12570 [Listeria newyorkensis]SQC55905.1 Uncharacterised protein [Listeria newyorkensis]